MSRPRDKDQTDATMAAAEQLAGLIREAHGAAKDLNTVLREIRKILADGAELARRAARQAGSEELARYTRHIQKEMNRAAAEMNASISRAQENILDNLTLAALEPDPDDPRKLKFYFKGGRFNADSPVPDGPELEVPTPACPRCGQPPCQVLGGGSQAFCGTDDCPVLTWNPGLTAEQNAADTHVISWPG